MHKSLPYLLPIALSVLCMINSTAYSQSLPAYNPITIDSYEEQGGVDYACYNVQTQEVFKSPFTGDNCLWIQERIEDSQKVTEINVYHAFQNPGCMLSIEPADNTQLPKAHLKCSGSKKEWVKTFITYYGSQFYLMSPREISPQQYLYSEPRYSSDTHYYLDHFSLENFMKYLFIQRII